MYRAPDISASVSRQSLISASHIALPLDFHIHFATFDVENNDNSPSNAAQVIHAARRLVYEHNRNHNLSLPDAFLSYSHLTRNTFWLFAIDTESVPTRISALDFPGLIRQSFLLCSSPSIHLALQVHGQTASHTPTYFLAAMPAPPRDNPVSSAPSPQTQIPSHSRPIHRPQAPSLPSSPTMSVSAASLPPHLISPAFPSGSHSLSSCTQSQMQSAMIWLSMLTPVAARLGEWALGFSTVYLDPRLPGPTIGGILQVHGTFNAFFKP